MSEDHDWDGERVVMTDRYFVISLDYKYTYMSILYFRYFVSFLFIYFLFTAVVKVMTCEYLDISRHYSCFCGSDVITSSTMAECNRTITGKGQI